MVSNDFKNGIVSAISSLGVVILLAGIFLDVIEFSVALVIAIALWIFSGVVATFLGVNKKSSVLDDVWIKSGNSTKMVSVTPVENSKKSQVTVENTQAVVNTDAYPGKLNSSKLSGANRLVCPSCYEFVSENDIFCPSCGQKL